MAEKILAYAKSMLFDNRSIKQIVFKNTFWLLVAEGAQKMFGLLIVIWLARYFAPEMYGQWSFAFSFVALFSLISDFGFGNLVVREIARDRSRIAEYIDNVFFLKLILGLITLGAIYLTTQFLNKDYQVVALIYSFGLYTVLYTFASFFQSIFRAGEKMQYEAISRVVQNILLFGLIAIFILNKSSMVVISFSYIIATIVGILFSLFLIWRYFSRFFLKVDLKICESILKEAWPFALSGVIVTIYLRIGIILLSLLKNDEAVGLYSAAFNLILALTAFPPLLMFAVYPSLSRFYSESKTTFVIIYKKSLKFVFIISILLFSILFLSAKEIILFTYGAIYSDAVIVFRILCVLGFFSFLSCVFLYTLNAMDKQIVYTKVAAVCLLVNIALCLLFIPNFSYIGLSIAAVVTEALETYLLFVYVNKSINKFHYEM